MSSNGTLKRRIQMRILEGIFVESEEENLFISFLVENKVYSLYMRNLGYVKNLQDNWNSFKKRNKPLTWFTAAFQWSKSETLRGYSGNSIKFWGRLSQKWTLQYAIKEELKKGTQ
jgi:hypothetical protein